MSTAIVTLARVSAQHSVHGSVPVLNSNPAAVAEKVTVSATHAEPSAIAPSDNFGGKSYIWEINAVDAAIFVKFGANASTTVFDFYIPSGQTRWYAATAAERPSLVLYA